MVNIITLKALLEAVLPVYQA